jgi:hypothetical protein
MNYGIETGRMVFHTDSRPHALYLTFEFEVFMEDLPLPPYPFASSSCCPPPYPFTSLSTQIHKATADHADQEVPIGHRLPDQETPIGRRYSALRQSSSHHPRGFITQLLTTDQEPTLTLIAPSPPHPATQHSSTQPVISF